MTGATKKTAGPKGKRNGKAETRGTKREFGKA